MLACLCKQKGDQEHYLKMIREFFGSENVISQNKKAVYFRLIEIRYGRNMALYCYPFVLDILGGGPIIETAEMIATRKLVMDWATRTVRQLIQIVFPSAQVKQCVTSGCLNNSFNDDNFFGTTCYYCTQMHMISTKILEVKNEKARLKGDSKIVSTPQKSKGMDSGSILTTPRSRSTPNRYMNRHPLPSRRPLLLLGPSRLRQSVP